MDYNKTLLNFLESIQFFQLSEGIYNYDKNYIGGFDKELRDSHKAYLYNHQSVKYYEIKVEDERIKYRGELFEIMRYKFIPSQFKEVLSDFIKIEQDLYDILNVITEVITNGILYSYSPTIASVQTDRYSTSFSVSDIGIGFEGSILKKKGTFSITKKIKENAEYKDYLKDFYIILDALEYSREQDRENLWKLKKYIIDYGGIFRIHYNSTQIVFTSSRCKNCEKSLYDCSKCLITNYKSAKELSPLRIFDVKFQGVHIEVELPNRRIK